ncbi:hypothetical protein CRG98_009367 [Punica granatum]|uniref:Uncharacterized protein n=1 Tax=Punica granatum TaxID=22663 RepID=A0A2I0KP15_PUNGR|nr:hypothetical protein CRG98_009367 [Punica granatum]
MAAEVADDLIGGGDGSIMAQNLGVQALGVELDAKAIIEVADDLIGGEWRRLS